MSVKFGHLVWALLILPEAHCLQCCNVLFGDREFVNDFFAQGVEVAELLIHVLLIARLFDFDLPHRLVYVLQEPLDFSIIFVDKLPGFFVLSHQIVFQGVPALVQICTHLVHSQVSTGGVFQLWP